MPTSDRFPPLRLKAALSLGGLSPREVVSRTWKKLNEHEILTRASAISFYAMLAFVPLLALILTVLVQLLPDLSGLTGRTTGLANLTVDQFRATLREALPQEAYGVVEDQIKRMQKEPPFGLLSFGLLIALWTSTSLFVTVMDSMNRVCGVEETRSFLRQRVVALIMTLIQSAILIGALIVVVAGPEILHWVGIHGHSATLALIVQWSVVALMVLLSFALAFYVGPDADQKWEWITPGSFVGTLAFLGFTVLFRIYIQKFAHYDRAYGSLGGVMALMLWLWVTSVILLTAGQVNQVIEDASPLGKTFGQKTDKTDAPDFSEMTPQPLK